MIIPPAGKQMFLSSQVEQNPKAGGQSTHFIYPRAKAIGGQRVSGKSLTTKTFE